MKLFETIRVCDGVAERVALHQARLLRSGGPAEPPLEQVIADAQLPGAGEFKLHVSYDEAGITGVHAERYVPRVIRRMRAVEADVCYPLKLEDRRVFDVLRGEHSDVDELIICRDGMVTDTTFSNLLFGEPGAWYTPEHCLLPGTRRESLLRCGEVRVRAIRRAEIRDYPFLCLINAMLEPGRLVVPTCWVEVD